jgi:hypothetical protein
MEKINHMGIEGVFIPQEDWERIVFLTKKKDNLLTKLVRSVEK